MFCKPTSWLAGGVTTVLIAAGISHADSADNNYSGANASRFAVDTETLVTETLEVMLDTATLNAAMEHAADRSHLGQSFVFGLSQPTNSITPELFAVGLNESAGEYGDTSFDDAFAESNSFGNFSELLWTPASDANSYLAPLLNERFRATLSNVLSPARSRVDLSRANFLAQADATGCGVTAIGNLLAIVQAYRQDQPEVSQEVARLHLRFFEQLQVAQPQSQQMLLASL
jgi:hypothetical protein